MAIVARPYTKNTQEKCVYLFVGIVPPCELFGNPYESIWLKDKYIRDLMRSLLN